MNNSKRIPIIANICRRYLSETVTEVPTPRFKKLKETQKQFQLDDGVPVYLKKGVSDNILLLATTALTGVGLLMSAETLYKLSFPKKN